MNKTLLVMAGGTGGHVFPALAVAKEMATRGYQIHWLGTAAGIETQLVNDYPLHTIDIAGLRGKRRLDLLTAPYRIGRATLQARHVIRQIQPDLVFGLGGYATGPGGVAARMAGVPLVIHEQNAYAGLTNRWLSRIATLSLQAFPNALPHALTTGNPVRAEIVRHAEDPLAPTVDGERRLRVLVVGGSLGAVALNEHVLAAMQQMLPEQRPELWHQVGARNIDGMQAAYANAQVDARVCAFIDDMNEAYRWADLVVCRAGALTVAEIAAAAKAAIFIPYPHAVDDHQTANARYLVDANAATLIPQAQLQADVLVQYWRQFDQDRASLLRMANAARMQAKVSATTDVANYLESCLRESK